MDKYIISQREVVIIGAPYRVNIPCHMHDTRLCQIELLLTITSFEGYDNLILLFCKDVLDLNYSMLSLVTIVTWRTL